jgi:phosphohistidine phosphatase
MKQLILARHAKSTWKEKEIDDIDRPLKLTGVQEAYFTAEELIKKVCYPERILTSTATRSIHTALIYSRLLKYSTKKIEICNELYLPTLKKLIQFIKTFDNNNTSIMIVGHDPSFTELTNYLLGTKHDKLPTASVISVDLKIKSWSDLKEKSGKQDFYIISKKFED